MPADPAAPDWRGLLAIGLDRLRDVRTYAWFFGFSVVLSLVGDLTRREGAVGMGISFVASMFRVYAAIVLARQLMIGQLAFWPQDFHNLMRIIVVWFAASIALGLPLIAVLLLFDAAGLFTTWLLTLVLAVPAFLYFMSRSALFLPALAIDDPVRFWQSFEQGKPYWGRLAVVIVLLFLPTILFTWGLGKLGLPWPIRSALEALIGAAAALMAEAAACYLYWRDVRGNV
jgi:hypothetical protein